MTIEIRRDLKIGRFDGIDLRGDAYLPPVAGRPAFVLLHGGAWTKGRRESYDAWARWLAGHGFGAITADYRLATSEQPSFPGAVLDVRAAIRYVRSNAQELGIDPARIGLIGGSAGAHLAAMAALTARSPAQFGAPDEPASLTDATVSVVIAMAGTYDMLRRWEHDQLDRPPADNSAEKFIGSTPMWRRRAYYEASPIFHASAENARDIKWLLAWGTQDDVAPPTEHSLALSAALKRAGALVRHAPVVGAPHFWYFETEVDEPGSYTEFLGRRILAFLRTWCRW